MTRAPHLWVGDIASLGAIWGAFSQTLPDIAALVGIVWYAVMIWESSTFRNIFHIGGPNVRYPDNPSGARPGSGSRSVVPFSPRDD